MVGELLSLGRLRPNTGSMRVKLSYSTVTEPLLRQTPGGAGRWKGYEFVPNSPEMRRCDIWAVLENPAQEETAVVETGRTVLIGMEARGADGYPKDYLAQFDVVISNHPGLPHHNVHIGQGPNWHIGLYKGADVVDSTSFRSMLSYDDFRAMPRPEKPKTLSVICSAARTSVGERIRGEFTTRLQKRLGDRVDVYGQGVRFVPDKAEAILPYRYHIALENNSVRHYWTEKLADSYLGWAFPIYWGCENIGDFFPEDSFIQIDASEPEEAIRTVESVITRELTPQQIAGMSAARELILDRYNTFDVVVRAAESLPPGSGRKVTIRPQRYFRKSRLWRLRKRVKKTLGLE